MNKDDYILACNSGYPPSEAVCDCGAWLAKNSGRKLKILHTLSQFANKADSNLSGSIGLGARSSRMNELVEKEHLENKERQQIGKEFLIKAQKRAIEQGAQDVETCLRNGSLVETLTDFQNETAVTVIGRYGRLHQGEKSQKTIGHHVEDIIRTVNTPIMVVTKEFKSPQTAIFAYNNSKSCKKALDFLAKGRVFKNLHIHIVHVGKDSKKSDKFLNEAKEKLKKAGVDTTVKSLSGNVNIALNKYADDNNIDMVIMGAYGHCRLKNFFFGSFTNKMLIRCDRPTLLLR
jgi:nucleotide-binding universal stress UspA family protein